MVPNLLEYLELPSAISLLLSYNCAADMKGKIIHKTQDSEDTTNEAISGPVEKDHPATLSKAPKDNSKYPSVKNLKKLLKKKDDIILLNIVFIFAIHTR